MGTPVPTLDRQEIRRNEISSGIESKKILTRLASGAETAVKFFIDRSSPMMAQKFASRRPEPRAASFPALSASGL
jgi:hypothetical protein